MAKFSVKDLSINGKKIFLRVDFNVPLDKNLKITDDTRIKASLPTIEYVLQQGGIPILASHLGRPKGKIDSKMSLAPVTKRLGELLNRKVIFVEDCVGDEVKKIAQALNGFRDKLNHASSLRDRFVWEIGLCNVMLWAKKPRLALPYIKEILGFLDEYKIEQWEPSLALEGLTITLSGLRLQEEGSKDEELIGSVLNRISALSPAAALDLL